MIQRGAFSRFLFRSLGSCLPLLGGLFLFSASSLSAATLSLDVLQRDGYGVIAIKRPEPNILTVIATIDGQKKTLVVDTGWGHDGLTLVSESQVRAGETAKHDDFGRSASGQKLDLLRKGTANEVRLGDVVLRNVPLNFASAYLGGHADGVVGAGFLETCSAIVDLQNLKIFLRPPGTGHRVALAPALEAAGLSAAPMELAGYSALVAVEINSVSGYMAIDTGAVLASVDSSVAAKMKVGTYRSRVGYIDAAGSRNESRLAAISSFKIGGVPVRVPDLRFSRFPFYAKSGGKILGLMGIDILGKNGAIIDFGEKKLFFFRAP